MGGFSPLSRAQFRTIFVNQFLASLTEAGVPLDEQPDTGPDSIMGAVADGLSALSEQLQFQAYQDQLASRLATTPANADGTVSADAASFAAPWGIVPAPGGYASTKAFQLNLASLSSESVTVDCGVVIQRNDGMQYLVIADASQADYNGSQGYTIAAETPYLTVTGLCLTQGTAGNVEDPSQYTWTIYGGPGAITAPMIASVTMNQVINNGTAPEQQSAFVARFTLAMQDGKWGVETAIIATALGVQSGLTVSYGDHIDQNGNTVPAYFTLVVNVAGSATAPSSTLLTNIYNALVNVRSGGIQYQVIAPTLIAPTLAGNVAVYAGFNETAVLDQVEDAVQNAINAIGLNQSGGTTTLSYAQTLALMISISGVNPVGTNLTIDGTTNDVTAPFASQIVCPTTPSFTVS